MLRYWITSISILIATFTASAFTLVIDAGHGGHDAGAVGSISKEKNINLKVALMLGDMLKEKNPDIKIIYTRDNDEFIELNRRAEIANKAKADLFVSIHTNSSKNKSANGMETFTLGVSRSKENMEVAMLENSVILLEDNNEKTYQGFDPNSTDSYIMFEFMKDQYMDRSIKCADFIQTRMIDATNRVDRGVRQAGFLVLRATTMPAVLVELGFISNKEEEKYLNDNKNQAAIVTAIYKGIIAYKHDIDKKSDRSGGAVTTAADTKAETTPVKPASTEEKQPAVQNTPEPASTPAQAKQSDAVEFYVQILVSKNNYRMGDPVFKGVKNITVREDNQIYKYLVGPYSTLDEASQAKASIAGKFPDSFAVAYQNGKRIDINSVK